jgi:hypothetical protein
LNLSLLLQSVLAGLQVLILQVFPALTRTLLSTFQVEQPQTLGKTGLQPEERLTAHRQVGLIEVFTATAQVHRQETAVHLANLAM